MDITSSELAGIYTAAAELITDHGYVPYTEWDGDYPGCDGTRPHSMVTAIEHVADRSHAEEALTRLAGLMYFTGHVTRRTSIDDITDLPSMWEHRWLSGSAPDGTTALRLLVKAAAFMARQEHVSV